MELIRIAAVGDIHAEDERLEKVLNFVHDKVDAILSVGDIVDGRGDADRCCSLLRKHAVFAVKGNHERWLLANEMRILSDATFLPQLSQQSIDWLRLLPSTIEFECTRGKVLLCHGLGTNDMKTLLPDDKGYALESNTALHELLNERSFRYVIKGHSHRRMVRRLDNVTFINAGTLRGDDYACFCIVDFPGQQIQFFDFAGDEIVETPAAKLP